MYRNVFCKHSSNSVTPEPVREKGFVLGSHIRAGLYEPVDSSISGLLKSVYDDDGSAITDVDPLCDFANDKFTLAKLGKKVGVNDVPAPAPKEE